ncbi:DUF5895 domain-containing protein [Acaryochloris sp. IP29b_bin.137]|uniref:DUF5895 domain-containing protein n=1 Tax=Acaryochloris sp. IP29b_bin.137 TaxID=2969217 RepID=UPI00261B12FD|nr:DUF5895 domain-containing protein [Acaryochloris sp. IP29b_bin.137]
MPTTTQKPNVVPITEAIAGFIDGEAYQSERQSLPYLQVLNDSDPERSGLFISNENVEASGFVPDTTWSKHLAQFKAAEVEGYRTLIPRLAIVRQSGLLMYDRATRDFMGQYQRTVYNRAIHLLKTRYLIFVLGADNKPLHSHPLLLTAKGSVCGSFGQSLRDFRNEVSILTKKRMGYRFHALWAFCPTLESALKGSGNDTSWVTSIKSFDVPTVENFAQLFLGLDEDTRLLIESAFDEYEDFASFAKSGEAAEAAEVKSQVEPKEPIPMDEMMSDIPF